MHIAPFEYNDALSRSLAESGSFDWAVTVMSYSALHLLQTYFVESGIEVRSHRDRDRQIRDLPDIKPILNQYRVHRVDSETARYECRRFTRDEYESSRAGNLTVVSNHVRVLLGGV